MQHLEIEKFGPIRHLDIQFGDLTILVGAQASGKSLSLELLKLILDRDHIIDMLDRYNYIWGHNTDKILNMYFGEGMSGVWSSQTRIMLDGTDFPKNRIPKNPEPADESLFYIPAQRILSISDGRPKNFMEFDNTTPYVLRSFSETLRLFMQHGMGSQNTIFPLRNRLKGFLRQSFDKNIFHHAKIIMEDSTGQKKMRMAIDDMSIPFMTWSAGQKEFMPLLLAFYCLSGPPSKVVKREKFKYVVLEEPEMGLHPRAIISVLLQVVELIQNGYQVIISTHSTVILEFAWAFNILQSMTGADKYAALNEIFGVRENTSVSDMLHNIFEEKSIKTYYYQRNEEGKVYTHDISTLDTGNMDEYVAEWGGISEFSSKVTDVVAKYMANEY